MRRRGRSRNGPVQDAWRATSYRFRRRGWNIGRRVDRRVQGDLVGHWKRRSRKGVLWRRRLRAAWRPRPPSRTEAGQRRQELRGKAARKSGVALRRRDLREMRINISARNATGKCGRERGTSTLRGVSREVLSDKVGTFGHRPPRRTTQDRNP